MCHPPHCPGIKELVVAGSWEKRRYFTENEVRSVERFRRLGHVVISASGKSERRARSTFLRFGDLNKARMANPRSSEIVLKWQAEAHKVKFWICGRRWRILVMTLPVVESCKSCGWTFMSRVRTEPAISLLLRIWFHSTVVWVLVLVSKYMDEKRRGVASEQSVWEARRHADRVFKSPSSSASWLIMSERISLGRWVGLVIASKYLCSPILLSLLFTTLCRCQAHSYMTVIRKGFGNNHDETFSLERSPCGLCRPRAHLCPSVLGNWFQRPNKARRV